MQTPTESETRRLVAELIHTGPRRGVALLTSEFRGPLGREKQRHFHTIVHALCVHSPVWKSELGKCISRVRRCPRHLREAISVALTTIPEVRGQGATLTPERIIRRDRRAKSKGVLEVDDPRELGWGKEHRSLLAKLHELAPGAPVDLDVHFKCDQLYVHGLALIAAWCERFAAHVSLRADSSRGTEYLEATGLRHVIEQGVKIDELLYDGHNHVALTSIHREERDTADQVANRIVRLFQNHIEVPAGTRTALKTVFAELVENVYRHAQASWPAYVMAQAYPSPRKLHVVVADTGIGIRDSFRKSTDPQLREAARSEQRAIELALKRLVTSKSEYHSGFGLFVISRLVQRNGGVMRFMSGETTKWFFARQEGRKRGHVEEDWGSHRRWHGTEVSLMFNLDNPFPLTEIYRELGPLSCPDDFFE